MSLILIKVYNLCDLEFLASTESAFNGGVSQSQDFLVASPTIILPYTLRPRLRPYSSPYKLSQVNRGKAFSMPISTLRDNSKWFKGFSEAQIISERQL